VQPNARNGSAPVAIGDFDVPRIRINFEQGSSLRPSKAHFVAKWNCRDGSSANFPLISESGTTEQK
jgi:hypothetical protein